MVTQISSVTPANGATLGPRPVIQIDVIIASESKVVMTNCVWTKSGETINSGWSGASSDAGLGSGLRSFFPSLGEDLPDGVWTLSARAFYSLNPRDYSQVDGGATTPAAGSPVARTYTIVSTVSATAISPAGGSVSRANYSDPAAPTMHQQSFQWAMNSNNSKDAQTAWTIHVQATFGGADIATLSSTTGTEAATTAVVPIANTYKDATLYWYVVTTNKWGAVRTSSTQSFMFATPPVVSVTTPVNNAALTSGVINIVTSATTTGGRQIKQVNASIWQGTLKVWERNVSTTLNSGVNITIQDSTFVLPQSGGTPYTLRVTHIDNLGIASDEFSRNFTVTYTPPASAATPTVSNSFYDSDGYMQVAWTNTGVDASFYAWVVERRITALDPYTLAVSGVTSDWVEVGGVYVQATTSYTYKDFNCPALQSVEYRVRQIAIRDGQQVYSTTTNASTAVTSITTAYWLTNQVPFVTTATSTTFVGGNGNAVKLWNVTGESFKRERVRNTFTLIGRGRYSEEGDKLGISGTFTAQLRDSGGTTARAKRLALQDFQDTNNKFLYRNPFGDSVTVQLGDIDITRIAGTGKSEFVDISIPYLEVV